MTLKFLSKAGFTMIELLVVIAVIGVLAVAVLSAINPIEQINKSRDTKSRSDAEQMISAAERYYATHESYPWNDTTATYTPSQTLADAPEAEFDFDGQAASAQEWAWVQALVDTAEVKEGFTTRIQNDANLYMYKADGYNETMYVCFIPTSKSFALEAAKNCLSNVTPAVTTAGGGADFFCHGAQDRQDVTITEDKYICLP